MNVRERRQTIQVYEVFKEKAQWGEFYRVYGLCLFLLGAYFLTVPFYNVVCQTLGLTMSQSHKDYRFAANEVNVFKKFKVCFMANAEDEIPWEFQSETSQLIVNAGETALAFYKVYNRSDKPIAGIAIYQIFPEEVAFYFNKIQCFCFENQLLYPNESVDLPLLFYLDPAINHDPNVKDTKEITLTYHFYPSADQTVAQVLQREIERHQKEEKELIKKHKELEARGIKLPSVDGHQGGVHGVLAAGYNPKDTPEGFVNKIMHNQKRIQYTIQKYEEEQQQLKEEEARKNSESSAPVDKE